MNAKTTFGLLCLILAYFLLVPGLFKPMITITGTLDKAEMVKLGKNIISENAELPSFLKATATRLISQLHIDGKVVAYQKTRSITGTVKDLANSGNYPVAFLIALFSIIIPVTKGLLIIASLLFKHSPYSIRASYLSNLISKWSMADVFVIAIIVAYMAANASGQSGDLLTMDAVFGQGFYFFLGYCLLSILSAQLLKVPDISNKPLET